MGKYFKREEEEIVLPQLGYEDALDAHAEAMERGARCTECPLFGLRQGPVLGEIKTNSRLTIIGEAPGKWEVKTGHPFVHKSGEVLDEALAEGGVYREECSVTNSILCRPPPPDDYKTYLYKLGIQYERSLVKWEQECEEARLMGMLELELPKPPKTPAECCAPRLARDIRESLETAQSPVVLALGAAALKSVAEHWDVAYGTSRKVRAGEVRIATIKKQVGSPVILPDGTIVMASFHPAFAMRKGYRHFMSTVRKHITRAAKIAVRGYIDWQEPKYILDPSPQTIRDVLERIGEYASSDICIDIETDKGLRPDGKFDPRTARVRCVGVGATVDGEEVILVIPFRRIEESIDWWDPDAKKYVIQQLVRFFRRIKARGKKLIGHNLAFDSLVLLRTGLLEDRTWLWHDTMIGHHDTQGNDHPHDLGFVISEYFEAPAHKTTADEKYYEDITDSDLHLYNAKDVLTTLRLWPKIWEDIIRCGSRSQYEVDQKLAAPARDMGDLGLVVDEVRRGVLSTTINREVLARRRKLGEIVKDLHFNPSSGPSVRKYLFQTKGCIPVLNTKSKEWQDGEDPATNVSALLKIKNSQDIDADTTKFIETFIEYKAYDKLRGTYIDNLQVSPYDWSQHGYDVGMAPAVESEVYTKWLTRDKVEALGYTKQSWRDLERSDQKRLLDSLGPGRYVKTEVLPLRAALSRLYTVYKIHVIPSGRMSTQPAVQNWPTQGKADMRTMIVAPPGHVLVGADMDQVELRIYAAVSGDKLLMKAFTDYIDGKPIDPHAWNAATLFARDDREESILAEYKKIVNFPKQYRDEAEAIARTQFNRAATAEELEEGEMKGEKEKKKYRNIAKRFVYLELYGGEEDKLFETMSTDRDKNSGALMFPGLKRAAVERWHKMWHTLHPETKQWQKVCEEAARTEGHTASPILGCRIRWFMGGPNKPGATYNHIIQSTAAEIANRALILISERIPYKSWSPFTGLCLQVHDFIGVYCPVERAEEAARIIEECMAYAYRGMKFTAKARITKGWSKQG